MNSIEAMLNFLATTVQILSRRRISLETRWRTRPKSVVWSPQNKAKNCANGRTQQKRQLKEEAAAEAAGQSVIENEIENK